MDLQLGVSMDGLMHDSRDLIDLESRFLIAKESGFDYIEHSTTVFELSELSVLQSRYQMPIGALLFWGRKGRDEVLLEWVINAARFLGAALVNVQLLAHDAEGRLLEDQEVAEFYLRAQDLAQSAEIDVAMETHVDMWSENPARIERVADLVEERGGIFQITLDHSHIIHKIDSPRAQSMLGMWEDVCSEAVVIDPFLRGNCYDSWLKRELVIHAHARSVVPNAPMNTWTSEFGVPGRGIQYPCVEPREGTFHSKWDESALAPYFEVSDKLLRHHIHSDHSRLKMVSAEFIPFLDYGAGSRYSLLENNIAIANWHREKIRALSSVRQ